MYKDLGLLPELLNNLAETCEWVSKYVSTWPETRRFSGIQWLWQLEMLNIFKFHTLLAADQYLRQTVH